MMNQEQSKKILEIRKSLNFLWVAADNVARDLQLTGLKEEAQSTRQAMAHLSMADEHLIDATRHSGAA